jgi:DNA-binding MarR family transcriptional regulator
MYKSNAEAGSDEIKGGGAATDALDQMIAKLLIANGNLSRRLQAESNFQRLTWSQVGVMSRLERGGPTTPAALARAEAVKPQSMSGTLANMETEGLVRRMPDPEDGRQILFELTEQGRNVRQAVRIARQDWLRSQMKNLSEDELDTLQAAVEIIGRMADN